jgi:hypothetical protein
MSDHTGRRNDFYEVQGEIKDCSLVKETVTYTVSRKKAC